jgi:rhodanese-related sulfurtransferase
MKMLELEKDAAKPIYLHCASGARAKLSAEQLIKMGYENVSVITCSLATIKQVHRT